jgi:hypothetical protein
MKFPYPLEGRSNKLAPMGNWRYMWSHLPFDLKAALYYTFMKGEKYAEEGTRLGVEEWITLISKYHYLLTSGKLRANDPMSELLFPTRTKLSDKAEQVRCSACGEIINRQDLRAGLCPECQERERECTCRKCGKSFTVTGLERNEQHRSYNYCEDCGSEVARRFFCINCRREYEITVGEMVSAYTAFVNHGIRAAHQFVTKIEDNEGNIVAQFQPRMNEVISEESAYKMIYMLKAVVDGGTGSRLRFKYNLKGELAGKTGTTNNNSDAWFMGITPTLVSGMWVGGDDRDIHFDSMVWGQGAAMALPIFALYMQKVYKDKRLGYSDQAKFDLPAGYNPCEMDESGLSDLGDESIEEVFE